jgi:hypothetical protein
MCVCVCVCVCVWDELVRVHVYAYGELVLLSTLSTVLTTLRPQSVG